MTTVHIGLGTNLGDRRRNLSSAITALASRLTLERVSAVYESEPVGYLDQPRFWNMAVEATTGMDALSLLRALKAIEQQLGRDVTFRMGPRTMDLDILLFGTAVLDLPGLVVPHPALMDRAFVLRPLLDLDPALRHPVTGEALADRIAATGGDITLLRIGSADEVLHDDDAAG